MIKQIESLTLTNKSATKTMNETLDLLEKQEEQWLKQKKELEQRAITAEENASTLTATNAKLSAELKNKVAEINEAVKLLEEHEEMVSTANECEALRREMKELKAEHAAALVDWHKLQKDSVTKEYMKQEMEHLHSEKQALQNAVMVLSNGMKSPRKPPI